jgi:ribosomal-protein-alanine N-acetyltransferase
MIELETARLKLRRFTWDDLDELARIGADPETRGFMWTGPADREVTTRNLRRWMEEYERNLGLLAMIYKPDGRLIGQCGLEEDEEGRVGLGYTLRKEYWCKGLAPEACAAVLEYGFDALGLGCIWSSARADNSASRRMMEKVGMSFRESKRTGAGEEVRYAVLREEFFGRGATSVNPA